MSQAFDVLKHSRVLLKWFPFCDIEISHLDVHLVGLEVVGLKVGFGCQKQGCVKGREFSSEREWPIKAPLDLREACVTTWALYFRVTPLGPPLMWKAMLSLWSIGRETMHTASRLAGHAIAPLLDQGSLGSAAWAVSDASHGSVKYR